jgi:NAD(P)H-dependent FMN reductase
MATSPGERGGQSVLETGSERFSRMGAKELISFSFPSFYDNFKEGKIVDKELLKSFKEQVNRFENAVNK